MKVWVTRLWADGTLLPVEGRKAPTPGRLEIDRPTGVPIARLLWGGGGHADPNAFPPLYDVQFVKASGTCMRLRGFEKPKRNTLYFQEWIVDFHVDGRGHFDMTLDAAVEPRYQVDQAMSQVRSAREKKPQPA